MNLGEQLKHYRKNRHLTQKQLADQLFVSDKTVSKWESGKGYPDLNTLPKIADLLNTTVDDLLNERMVPQYYEYKSARQIFGKPLVHIVLPIIRKINPYSTLFFSSQSIFMRAIPQANGIISIGVRAKGLLSIGLLARGLISLGILSTGLFSIGVFAIGLLAIGDASFGLYALGNIGFGLFVLANIAFGVFTSGNLTFGFTAIGNQSYGPHSFSLGDDYTLEMYQTAVSTLQKTVQQPIADAFYNLNIWLHTQPLFIVILVLGFVFSLILSFFVIYLKRRKLFFTY
ncbi:hypothetical protein IGI37_000413 [Enterococcus sp. AZ194]|uniref:helix-turn-helix domain-containing protein n=1 Tax=Enterococcus sp. AZ194 TaxID=2774629 RepID=UPI003F2247EA